ncbi:L,D-peptidoglycan transpeptidase YkuD (ErfK/YbiS/YcfS/YnhG family) [Kitasatospora gansuensis]|uniref:L,D-peptidoglycan transpeptidase YkuD (ErfK/YbiS/YcfS/YnhG family) n=1 Tax=Kitasatospora gansuensis TaxID=258050 RepID=A0A7W7SDS2_9ACTN|nr:L,D-transpeptidase family protein [Kitasatospora gansuensis]MBB4948604.1 L,D-peptidoglycan transpeptidase YkuD (ErfK/YbiS/YcfS/YnhG family) [Kitasatospora gansuensis]
MSGSHRAKPRSRADEPAAAAARPRGHRRKAKKKRGGRALMGSTAMLLAAVSGWFTVGPGRSVTEVAAAGMPDRPLPDTSSATPTPDAAAAQAGQRTEQPAADRSDRSDGSVAVIPGLGPKFTAQIPADTRQLVVATGKDKNASETGVTLWSRTADNRWKPGAAWAGHNAYKGWTTDHRQGDLRSPIGIYALTDAGGRKADPGSRLPYDQDSDFVIDGDGFNGEPLAGSFDYVVAINYNRVAGTSPLSTKYPEGVAKGTGIWLHVDHGGPTHGCVSLPEAQMVELIKALDPAAKPMIVMGDAASLAA